MLKNYAYTTFEDVSVSFFASVIVPFGFQFLLGFVICLLMSNLVFTLFSMLLFAHLLLIPAHSLPVWHSASIRCHLIFHLKTIEGAFGGLVVSMILNAVALTLYNKLANSVIPQNMATLLLAMVLPTSFMGMMGDLSASVLKRNFGVKDFGKIFPGHGGVMDRMDSSLFTLPVTYAIALVATKLF